MSLPLTRAAGAATDPGVPGAPPNPREAVAEHFLTALEDLVWRYRALAGHPQHAALHAEVLTAEVAFQLAVARRALHRHPRTD